MRKFTLKVAIFACFFLVFYGIGYAKVSGPCYYCHTMHNSQNGSPVARGDAAWGEAAGSTDAIPNLLVSSCVGCHSNTGPETIKTIGSTRIPIVFNTNGYPAQPLAGGNFFWVLTDDTKGHNVFASNPEDTIPDLDGPDSEAPGYFLGCKGNNSCHANIHGTASAGMFGLETSRQGCTKCHMVQNHDNAAVIYAPMGYHHADDTVDTVIDTEEEGRYRFLDGHAMAWELGVTGIEDPDWEQTPTATEHNEYLGKEFGLSSPAGMAMSQLQNTMTGFCCGCHGNFHVEQSGGAWIRHPSDAVIPDRDEYADAYGAAGSGTGVYNPQVPVARDELTGWPGPSAAVTLDSDMVMCLSCHRAHGSPYPDMLRWDYDTMSAGGGGSGGCFTCHTQKN